MEKRKLGRSELSIAPLVLGGNVFGWTADEKTSFAILDAFVDHGFNAIDTADVYSAWSSGGAGISETIIGRWLKASGKRGQVVIATKLGSDMGEGRKGLSARYMDQAVEASLKRLQTDVIDLYQSHWDDPETPQDETMAAYARLVAAGKVRVIGASNFTADRITSANAAAQVQGGPRYESDQPLYNLMERSAVEASGLNRLALDDKIGLIPYYGLAAGFLTGKYRTKADLAKSVRGRGVEKYLTDKGLAVLNALDAVSGRRGATPAQVALAWQINKPFITAPIASATSVAQVEDIAKAAALKLSDQDMAELDRASA